jgi:CRISPR/Cas system-associated exonuclease Cas4 (RecB family)
MLVEILSEYAQAQINKPRQPKEAYWPSDAGKCIRALVYQWRGVEGKPQEIRSFFVKEDGNIHHRAIKEQLRKAGINFIMEETPIKDKELPLSGKLDAVIRLEGKYYALEIKSLNRYSFDEIVKLGPREDHSIQLQLYIHYLKNLFHLDVNLGLLLYKCKDTARLWEFPLDYDKKYVEKFFSTVELVKKHLKEGTLPERQYHITDWECRYCDYSQICWKGYQQPLEFEVKEIKEENLKNLLGELIWIREKKKELEEKDEELTAEIKSILSSCNTKVATIGDYRIELKEVLRKRLDKELLEKALPNLESFYKTEKIERLEIKEM